MPPLLAWFLYGNIVGLLAAGVARAAEWILSRADRSVRWAWLWGMVLTGLVPLLQVGRPLPLIRLPVLAEVDRHLSLAVQEVTGTGLVPTADGGLALAADPTGGLLTAWGLVTGIAVLWLAGSVWRLHRMRSAWTERRHDGEVYYRTAALGPGVVGVLRQRILLPRWVLDLEEEDREMIRTHEREHVRAGDNRILAAGFFAVILMPWILPLWWQFRRLRAAVELDCDRRVLDRFSDDDARRRYGRLLLRVASGSKLLPAVPFSGRSGDLERRILQIAPGRAEEGSRVGRTAAITAAAGLLVCALAVPAPGAGTGWSLLPLSSPEDLVSTFEPEYSGYDREPVLLNGGQIRSAVDERYPASLRDRGIEGKVGLALHVDPRGRVNRARLADPSPYPAFNSAARELAFLRRYRPARRDGAPVGAWRFWVVEFRLER